MENFSSVDPWLELRPTPLAALNGSGDEAASSAMATASALLLVCDSNASAAWKLWDPVCSLHYDSLAALVVVSAILALITLWTVVGNLLVLLALYRFRSLRTMNNILIGNLAVSDLLLAATVLPLSITNDMLGYWVFGEAACVTWLSLDVLYCTASIWGLLTIAFDRYTATAYPLWYHENRSPKRALLYVLFVWIFSVIISFAPFIGWREMMSNSHRYLAELNRYECMLFDNKSYVVYSATGSFILPLTLMLFLYMRIFIALHQRAKRSRAKAKALLASGKGLGRLNGCHRQLEETTVFATTMGRDTTIDTMATATTYTSLLAANNGLQSPKIGELPAHIEGDEGEDEEEEEEEGRNNVSESESERFDDDEDDLYDDDDDEDDVDDRDERRRDNDERAIRPIYSMKRKTTTAQSSTGGKSLPLSVSADSRQGLLLQYPSPPGDGRGSLSPGVPDLKQQQPQQRNGLHHHSQSGSALTVPVALEGSRRSSFNLSDNEQDTSHSSRQQQQQPQQQRQASRRKSGGEPLRRSCRLTSSMKRRFELREQRATKRMVLILACFMVCWIPFLFMYVIRSFCKSCNMDIHGIIIIIWLGYANSSLNPIMYTIFNTDFRRAFIKILHLKVKRKGRRTF